MKIFFKYIKYNLTKIIFSICFFFMSSLLLFLYNIPIVGILYFDMLIGFALVIFFLIDYFNSYTKCKELQSIIEDTSNIIDKIPNIKHIHNDYYKQIVEKLNQNNLQTTNYYNFKLEETINYYSLWVHQIKTPIASMKLKLQNEDTENSRNMMQDLKNIERYVNMAITYLRLNSDSTDFQFKTIQIDDIIKPIIKSYSSDFIYKKIKLNYSDLNHEITTDEKWITFAIEQILSNAIKYTNTGSISISIIDNTLIIKDTGIGISQEDLPRIFEKGFTGENGRIDKSATGIGLYLCKRICKNLGHEIKIESKVNKGTTVKIVFQKTIDPY